MELIFDTCAHIDLDAVPGHVRMDRIGVHLYDEDEEPTLNLWISGGEIGSEPNRHDGEQHVLAQIKGLAEIEAFHAFVGMRLQQFRKIWELTPSTAPFQKGGG